MRQGKKIWKTAHILPLNIAEIIIHKTLKWTKNLSRFSITMQYCIILSCINIYLPLQLTPWMVLPGVTSEHLGREMRPSIYLRHKWASNPTICSLEGCFYWPFSLISMHHMHSATLHATDVVFSWSSLVLTALFDGTSDMRLFLWKKQQKFKIHWLA